MDKVTFRTIERKLYNYYSKKRVMTGLNTKREFYINRIKQYENDLKTNNFTLEEESSSPQFGERVQTSPSGMGHAERSVMQEVDRREIAIKRLKEKIYDLDEKITEIEADCIIIDNNIEYLSDENKKFIYLKYCKKLSDWQVGSELGFSKATANRIRNKIVENVADWEQLVS